MIESTHLKRHEHSFFRQVGNSCGKSDVSGLVSGDLHSSCAWNDQRDEGSSVEFVIGNNNYRPTTALFPTFCRIQIDEVDLAAKYRHQ